MRPRGWTFTGWAFSGSAGLGALLLALILHLDRRARDLEERHATAERDYKTLIQLRLRYRELEIRKSKMPPDTGQAPQSWPVFLEQKADEAGLPKPVIMPELQGRGALKESAFTVSLDAPTGTAVSRRQFVKFLDLVETQRPGFKSKSITLKFSTPQPEDLSRASTTFSHFER